MFLFQVEKSVGSYGEGTRSGDKWWQESHCQDNFDEKHRITGVRGCCSKRGIGSCYILTLIIKGRYLISYFQSMPCNLISSCFFPESPWFRDTVNCAPAPGHQEWQQENNNHTGDTLLTLQSRMWVKVATTWLFSIKRNLWTVPICRCSSVRPAQHGIDRNRKWFWCSIIQCREPGAQARV